MQETQVQIRFQFGKTSHETKQLGRPTSKTEDFSPRTWTHDPQQKKPLQWKALTQQIESSSHSPQLGKSLWTAV